MMPLDRRIDRFLSNLSNLRFQDLDIKEVFRLLGITFASRGSILTLDGKIIAQHRVPKEKITNLNEIKGNVFSQELEVSGLRYHLYLIFSDDDNLVEPEREKLRDLLKIVAQALSITNITRARISEFQIVNELNLNIITTMEPRKVIWYVESAARRLLNTDSLYLYYLIEDHLVGRNKDYSIKILPEEVYRQVSKTRQVMKLDKDKKENRFLKFFFDDLHSGIVLVIPFTIKNMGRGFFILDDFDKIKNQANAIMRLKFLGNQAAIALERIELFQALNKALQESRGLQEIAKLLLSPYELKYFFNEVLRRAQQILGFKKILVSFYNPATDSFDRMYSIGISKKKFQEAKKVHPPYRLINSLLEDRFRISNSYFIPYYEEVLSKIREYEVYKTLDKKRVHNLWTPGDVLISPIYSRDGNILGILSLDEPMDNRIPERNKIRLLEAFGDFLGLAIENNELFQKNAILSYTDDLTGVYNYRFLREKLEELIKRGSGSIGIAMIDFDRFKEYNDRFGHLAGDLLLKDVSQVLKDVVKGGYVTRYGGDEFIIILPKARMRGIRSRIEEVRQRISSSKTDRSSIKFSCGFAIYPDDGKDFEALIDCADRRLYQEKRRKYDEDAS